jgi:hypothetical protein
MAIMLADNLSVVIERTKRYWKILPLLLRLSTFIFIAPQQLSGQRLSFDDSLPNTLNVKFMCPHNTQYSQLLLPMFLLGARNLMITYFYIRYFISVMCMFVT